jgi:hypothetical protein
MSWIAIPQSGSSSEPWGGLLKQWRRGTSHGYRAMKRGLSLPVSIKHTDMRNRSFGIS